MLCRIVRLSLPCMGPEANMVAVNHAKIHLVTSDTNIYQTVKDCKPYFSSKKNLKYKKMRTTVHLADVINLHNDTGIRDLKQITEMAYSLRKGEQIFEPEGLPNIKVAKYGSSEFVLFDGHHSMLAYMMTGSMCLDEVPHLVVYGESGTVRDCEILAFFGRHGKIMNPATWRDYVINWQAPANCQVCPRIQNNMGELFSSLRGKIMTFTARG